MTGQRDSRGPWSEFAVLWTELNHKTPLGANADIRSEKDQEQSLTSRLNSGSDQNITDRDARIQQRSQCNGCVAVDAHITHQVEGIKIHTAVPEKVRQVWFCYTPSCVPSKRTAMPATMP